MELNRPTLYDIACHFYVSHVRGATIPATRLSNILEAMYRGQLLTAMSLRYLQQQNLTELHQLALGQITYEAFIAMLAPALVAREEAAKSERQIRCLESQRKQEVEDVVRVANSVREAARLAQLERERETAEAARIAREAEWTVQYQRNVEAAETRYKALMSEPGCIAPTPYDIAQHCWR